MAYISIGRFKQWGFKSPFNGGGKGDSPPSPDYTPMANASKEAAEIGAKLGEKQLAENQRQYDKNLEVAQPIVQQQMQIAQETADQGADYNNYMKQYSRPVEQSLFFDAMGLSPEEIAQYNQLRSGEQGAAEAKRTAALGGITSALGNAATSLGGAGTSLASAQKAAVEASSMPGFYIDSKGQLVTPEALKGYGDAVTKDDSQRWMNYNEYVRNAPDYEKMTADGYKLYQTGDPRSAATMMDMVSPDDRNFDSAFSWVKSYDAPMRTVTPIDNEALTRGVTGIGDAANGLSETAKGLHNLPGLYNEDNAQSSTFINQASARAGQRQEDEAAGKAIADARVGTTQQMNQLLRQGMRYGMGAEKLASNGGALALAGAQSQVAGANAGRTQAKQLAFAKKLDVAGLYKGLPGASTAAYGVATNAGNSAVGNQNATSAQFMNGMAQGNNTIMAGKQMQISGLGSVLGSQTSSANAAAAGGGGSDNTGAIIGGVASIAAAFI